MEKIIDKYTEDIVNSINRLKNDLAELNELSKLSKSNNISSASLLHFPSTENKNQDSKNMYTHNVLQKHYYLMKYYNEIVLNLSNEILEETQKNCQHDYTPDYSAYDPCRTYFICKKCNKSY
ncbi:MAG: hypothetical protein Terrestrivirus3_65 [Terrestrivirus sp.]|uniref:Uncharacterized protein n=1 Tax=Terrestrivirus sp. TaxID=2487775 RepID=A0A3G4ZLT1_9VIRU|nr:MAG: hypothetical protein Terrestrivirus3_65 [Terrestrivirus sp.]